MLQKTSLTTRDGVFVNPLIGKKKSGDFVDEVIIKCYETLIEHYYPKNRCQLATLHTEMRYAGPKEAIHHGIMRQNYGFTNDRVCPHDVVSREQLSGTKLRTMILEGKSPSEFILRPEVSKIIMDYNKPFVD